MLLLHTFLIGRIRIKAKEVASRQVILTEITINVFTALELATDI